MDNLTNLTAEQSVIGALLQNPASFADLADMLSIEDFANLDNGILFGAIGRLFEQSKHVDAITVLEECGDAGERLFEYATDLVTASSFPNAKSYAQIVKDYSTRRRIYTAAQDVAEYVVSDPRRTLADVIDYAQTALTGVDADAEKGLQHETMAKGLKSYVSELQRRKKEGKTLQGLPSGFEDIDRITNGYKNGHLIIIAGRPSMGKSTYGLQLASDLSIRQGKHGLFFSLETPVNDLHEKILAQVGEVDLDKLQDPQKISDIDGTWERIGSAGPRIKVAPLDLVGCSGMHLNQLKSYARKVHRNHKLDYLMVDHIHILASDGHSREREMANISGSLKALAFELDIPVFAIAQLNRGLESRNDKRPVMSDLRDSGSLEQDADQIQFIYRDDYYDDSADNPNIGLVQIDVVKHRNGRLGKVTLHNRFDQSRLELSDKRMQFEKQKKKSLSGNDL